MLAETNLPSKGKFIEGIRKKQRRITHEEQQACLVQIAVSTA